MITTFFGGSMTCESEYGSGAKFIFSFNLEDADAFMQENPSGRCLNPMSRAFEKFKLLKKPSSDKDPENRGRLTT